eukprot:TRINITY_DN23498_c0_g1_i1.p1 TRINITY_DN23498_c0_g1~~TRINITY_DN23498_c0_g1_i1.p1  ORF type:complete len:225 (+),score=68.12 TRINITY_DN23498_c0_g1_i1:80-754(+)
MPAKPKKKSGGYGGAAGAPVADMKNLTISESSEVAPQTKPEDTKVVPKPKKIESKSESSDDSDSDSSDGVAPQPQTDRPKFKTKEELRAWEAELKEQALADKATLARLEEVRLKREKQRLEREAAEKAAAEEASREKAKAEAADELRQQQLSERPTLELPGPKDVKAALMRLQECASDEFQKKHGIKGTTGNKLAKIKNAEFKVMFDDFQANGDIAELHKYKGT